MSKTCIAWGNCCEKSDAQKCALNIFIKNTFLWKCGNRCTKRLFSVFLSGNPFPRENFPISPTSFSLCTAKIHVKKFRVTFVYSVHYSYQARNNVLPTNKTLNTFSKLVLLRHTWHTLIHGIPKTPKGPFGSPKHTYIFLKIRTLKDFFGYLTVGQSYASFSCLLLYVHPYLKFTLLHVTLLCSHVAMWWVAVRGCKEYFFMFPNRFSLLFWKGTACCTAAGSIAHTCPP